MSNKLEWNVSLWTIKNNYSYCYNHYNKYKLGSDKVKLCTEEELFKLMNDTFNSKEKLLNDFAYRQVPISDFISKIGFINTLFIAECFLAEEHFKDLMQFKCWLIKLIQNTFIFDKDDLNIINIAENAPNQEWLRRRIFKISSNYDKLVKDYPIDIPTIYSKQEKDNLYYGSFRKEIKKRFISKAITMGVGSIVDIYHFFEINLLKNNDDLKVIEIMFLKMLRGESPWQNRNKFISFLKKYKTILLYR